MKHLAHKVVQFGFPYFLFNCDHIEAAFSNETNRNQKSAIHPAQKKWTGSHNHFKNIAVLESALVGKGSMKGPDLHHTFVLDAQPGIRPNDIHHHEGGRGAFQISQTSS